MSILPTDPTASSRVARKPRRRPLPDPFEAERRAVREAIIEFNRWYDVGAMVLRPWPGDGPDEYMDAYIALKAAMLALFDVLPWQETPPAEGDEGIAFVIDLSVSVEGVQYALVYDRVDRKHHLLLGGWPEPIAL